ncbi:MAG: MiaB/RimO family radical SAM methylthiotransferase [Candidatus Hydrothermia bacterium]
MMDSERIFIETLGCPKNEVDTRIIKKSLLDRGINTLDDASLADTILINTCGFLQEAIDETLERIRYWKRKKKSVIVTGCAVERLGKNFFKLRKVESLYLDEISGLSHSYPVKRQRTLPCATNQIFDEGKLYHYLKVQEGCKRRCTYCVISRIRGPLRSRSIEDLVREIEMVKEKGVVEVILIAQDLALYGLEIGTNLVELLKHLPDHVFYRLMYLHPAGISEELIKTIGDKENILPYLHIPIQHISQKVLKSMGRAGGEKAVRKSFELVKKFLPDFYIRTDIMVGFPAEEDEDFEGLINFLEEVSPQRIAVFKYSHEPGVPSYTLEELLEEVKEERYQIAFEVVQNIMMKAQKDLVGKEILVFKDNNDSWSQYDAPHIDFEVTVEGLKTPRWWGKVKIEKVVETLDLVGFPVMP